MPWLVLAMVAAGAAGGQLAGSVGWQPAFATPGLAGTVAQVVVQSNGQLVAAGDFSFAAPNGQVMQTVARWNGSTWQPLGSGPSLGHFGKAVALVAAPGGALVLAARTQLIGLEAITVTRWDGTHWQSLGSPAETTNVWGLAVLGTGTLVAGRGPTSAHPGCYRGGLVRWNGQHWQPYAPVPAGTELRELLVTRKGELLAAGYFGVAGSQPQPGVARWTGTTWQRLGPALNNAVLTLAQNAKGEVLVGGDFTDAGGNPAADHVARWDGTAWRPLATGLDGRVLRLLVGPAGEVIANGEFSRAGSVEARCIARWDGQRWLPLVPRELNYCKQVLAILPGGDLLGANSYGGYGGYYKDLLRYHAPAPQPAAAGGEVVLPYNSYWRPLASPRTQGLSSDCNLTALAATATGQLAISGYMQLPGTNAWQYTVARYDGRKWQELWGIDGRQVLALTFLPGGELLAAGVFPVKERGGLFIEGSAADLASRCHYVASWDGQAWQPLGDGPPGPVFSLAQLPGGDVLAGGRFGVVRWNGHDWQPVGPAAPSPDEQKSRSDKLNQPLPDSPGLVTTLAVAASGDIYAANSFGSRIMHWDGQHWQPLPPPGEPGYIGSIAAAPNGDLLAAGTFAETARSSRKYSSVARWNGTRWQFLGGPLAHANVQATVTADDRVVIVENFISATNGVPVANLAQWNGTGWQAISGGLNDNAQQLVAVPGGGFAVAGRFTATGDSTQSLGHVGVYRE